MQAYKLFNKYFSKRNIKKIYETDTINSGSVGLDKINHNVFQNKLEENLEIIYRKVHNDTYKYTPYKEKLILKSSDKPPRQLSIPTIRDRIVLKIICNFFQGLYKSEVKFEIPQIKVEEIKKVLSESTYDSFIKIDIINFYPSINHDILLEKLKKRIRKKSIINLILKSIKNGTENKTKKGKYTNNALGVPQGLSISNILAEIYINEVDHDIIEKYDIKYFRYVDDILILCKNKDKDLIYEEMNKLLCEELELKIHSLCTKGKTEIGSIKDGFSFLGYKFKNELVTINNSSVMKFEESISKILTKYKYMKKTFDVFDPVGYTQWRLNLKITGCIYGGQKRGWMFYFSQINDKTILNKIDATISKMLKRYKLNKEINQKKLFKVFFESQRKYSSKHFYIINFDNLTIKKKKEILEHFIIGKENVLKNKTDKEIDKLYNSKIRYLIKDLEQDTSNFS